MASLPTSLVVTRWRKEKASVPAIRILPMWLTSKSPTWERTVWYSSTTPLYWMGISHPAKSTSLAPLARCCWMRGVCRIMIVLTYLSAQSSDTEQLNIENQGGIRWNDGASALCAIAKLGRNGQLSLPANFHPLNALIPSLDDS